MAGAAAPGPVDAADDVGDPGPDEAVVLTLVAPGFLFCALDTGCQKVREPSTPIVRRESLRLADYGRNTGATGGHGDCR